MDFPVMELNAQGQFVSCFDAPDLLAARAWVQAQATDGHNVGTIFKIFQERETWRMDRILTKLL